jgi:hypothetical protein
LSTNENNINHLLKLVYHVKHLEHSLKHDKYLVFVNYYYESTHDLAYRDPCYFYHTNNPANVYEVTTGAR